MKRKLLIIVPLIIITIIVVSIIASIMIYESSNTLIGYIDDRNMSSVCRAIVVKVNKKSLGVIKTYGFPCKVNYSEADNEKFRKGQQIMIYYSGYTTIDTNPPLLIDVGKIVIEKETSDIEISDDIIRFFDSF